MKRRTSAKQTPQQAPQSESDDRHRIETIVELIYQDLLNEGGRFKVSELIKTIELKRKLAPPDDRGQRFWNMIDDLRAEERPTQTRSHAKKPAPETESLQANETR